MEWNEAIKDIDILAVLVATASTFVVGSIWYAWGVFGKTWAKHVGLKKADFEKAEGKALVMTKMAAGSLVAASVMYMLMMTTGTVGLVDGLIFGFILGVAFRMTTHIMHNGFAQRPDELTHIDSFHDILQMMVMGAILGLFL